MEDGVPPPDIASNAMLVESARHGSAAAKEALFRRYAPMVNGLALRLLGRDADVDDLVQETFLQAFGSLEGLKEPSIFGSWIASIVVHTAHKLLRRRRLLVQLGLRRRDPIDVDALLAPTAPPEVVLEVRSIYEVIDDLPPKLRIPLLLRRAEGLELAEIAELTGASLATVKRRLAEAEERLRAAPTLRRRP
jgi:RNA polymerase sigma-70 factor (ECF subfamily)